ncbi:MAG: hypothetical protein DRJ49_03975 [Thermoprotei archaeon]|nr:MAG: hypothetical protein DRN53_04010 [Thermoprotei archaeon]RLE89137.1 MAG: hypothetical protein DRJ49_03975 [Thermoprotei archaeon]
MYFPAWEVVLAIGIIVLIVGILMAALKKRGGLLLTFIGVGWLITFGLYFVLVHTGLYGKIGSGPGLVLNAVGVVILMIGLIIAYSAIRRARG